MEVDRVQSIASSMVDNIPSEFVRSEKERPGTTTHLGPAPDIPTVDLSDPDYGQVLQKMVKASKEWGIFQLVNHGIPEEVIRKLQAVGKEFFELPQEEKEAYARDPNSGSLEGYGTRLQKDFDGKKSWVDFFFHIVWPPSRINFAVWPKKPAAYRECNEEYTKYLVDVVDKILGALSEGLGVERNTLKNAVGGEDLEYMLKINYYPPCPRPDLTLGVVQHTDMSSLTLLVPNEVQGLQVFKDGIWFDAKYIPNALIVHIGDQIEILSNGIYKAVLHRTTVNKEKARMSWPVFCEPPPETVVGPIPELLGEDNPPKFKTKSFKDYQYCKLNKLPQ
ncbi:flavonol synthase/flavanone 3-hydroxylase [Nymphaea colorata]|nr:flavonol synthase/flavanone 3-hydroxylase [Nymphaea colorata]XP_049935618.1 flavonol synthase/flavanone 3-hydroxylase [Nymphaea colorata]